MRELRAHGGEIIAGGGIPSRLPCVEGAPEGVLIGFEAASVSVPRLQG